VPPRGGIGVVITTLQRNSSASPEDGASIIS